MVRVGVFFVAFVLVIRCRLGLLGPRSVKARQFRLVFVTYGP